MRKYTPMKLTAKKIDNASREKDGAKLFDGKGLFLELHKNGSKYWRYKYRSPITKKEKLYSLGVYPEITLADARDKHRQLHKLVSLGEDPMEVKKALVEQKRSDHANTFELIAREWLEYKKTELKEQTYIQNLKRLEKDFFPVMGLLPIKSITHQTLIDLAKGLQERGANELAKRSIQMCKHIFQYAIINGYADKNIAEDLKGFIKTPPTKSFASIEPKDLPDLLQAIDSHKSRMHRQSQIALELMMLTFVRTGELIKAEWGEFDLDHAQWVIPGRRMKMKVDHIVPLSKQAIALIEELRVLHRNNHWAFPSRTRSMNHMSNNTILMALRRMGYGGIMTGHGFRSLAMTTIQERLGYPHDIPDAQLAHGKGGSVRKAYDRSQYLNQRVKMMQEWADYLDEKRKSENVV
ncbi:MAG: integrase arm-type DNA-binding domain-containing protein [Pseudomonadota bacterium]